MPLESLNFLLSCFSFAFLSITSVAVDILGANETVRHGDTIVSAGEIFELGFFSPEKSNNWYLGIWYKKISSGTVVWVANTEIPLNESSAGVLKFDERGILVLLNQNQSIIWSSNVSTLGNAPVAQLLDSGNFVVRHKTDNSPENFLWQSFDHPGNTLLPGMKFGTTITGLDLYISSWKSTDDPSKGDYTFQLDPVGLQSVIKQGSVVKARSGPWNGMRFSGIPYMKPNLIYNYTFVFNKEERYYTYEVMSNTVFSRLVLNPNGVMQRLTWIGRTGGWIPYLSAPADYCDNYAFCGVYGSCDTGNFPACGCLNGFIPKYQKEWDRADWSSGCVRRTPLDCQTGDGFRLFSNVKLPAIENLLINASMTLEECKVRCSANCSCMAYANSDIRGNGSGCFLWFGDLIDIRQYRETGQDLYVRVAASEIVADPSVGSKQKKQLAIILSSVLLTGVLLLGLGIILVRKKKQMKWCRSGSLEEHLSMDNQENDLELPHFDLTTIANATNNFAVNNMLGKGGFGFVYKGVLENGQEIAVKRLSKNSRQGLHEFKNEVKCIAKLQHRNLVKLLGYCIQLEEKMLIYEYMANKSLDFYIFDQMHSKSLDWPKRFRIITGISRGLLYLHQDSRLRIIHRDLKLSNILLDNKMNPKISDFGMARIFESDETEANTKRVVGTYGYMSPEYAIDGLFSTKSDVFSFGVLVLEIVSGKKNRGFSHPDHQHNLLGHAWRLFKEGRYYELIDAVIKESCELSEVLRSVHVGLLCVQHNPGDRPSMSSLVVMLSGEGFLPEPKEPGFFAERKVDGTKSSTSKSDSCSVNEVTVTTVDAR